MLDGQHVLKARLGWVGDPGWGDPRFKPIHVAVIRGPPLGIARALPHDVASGFFQNKRSERGEGNEGRD